MLATEVIPWLVSSEDDSSNLDSGVTEMSISPLFVLLCTFSSPLIMLLVGNSPSFGFHTSERSINIVEDTVVARLISDSSGNGGVVKHQVLYSDGSGS